MLRILLCLCLLAPTWLFSQEETPARVYTTVHVQGLPPVIDGLLNDEAWDQVEWAENFIQRTPEDGAAPSQQTKFKILYDAKFLYVGVFALDTEPDKVARRMSRRDGFEGDFVEINIDSYHDKRTAFSFSASASGVKGEEYVSNNGDNWDPTWDPIWYLKTSLNDEGWIAEFKIPLSQLRFSDQEEHVWGIQMLRYVFRKQERSYWQPIPQAASGWVHRFGELRGLKGIKPQKQLEIQPYVVAKTERSPIEENNPYATGSASDLDVGIDAKIGITSDITLDLTINPDFGQVEADPSQVNLSAFQLYFRERRPFFLEGNNTLNYGLTDSQAGGQFNNDNLYYSRRIGSRPSYDPEDEDDVAYVDKIQNSHILGAAKLTGKNENGLSWGILESVTKKESVEITDTLGQTRDVFVAPMTSYTVARVQQDINEGNALLGAMFTSTQRTIDEPQFNVLHKSAYSGGVDFKQFFDDRNYYFSANGVFSDVKGKAEAITETQTSSERYFQRPDNRHNSVDSTRTSLTGTAATTTFGKQNGNVIFQTGATMRSPELELNDVGFLVQTDFVSQWSWVQYRILKPKGNYRWIRLNANQYLSWDFDGNNLYKAVNLNGHVQFKNLWSFSAGSTIEGEKISNADLRGGPAIRYPGSSEFWAYLGTNEQKKIYMELNPWYSKGKMDYYQGGGISTFLRYQPTDALKLSISPSVDWNYNELQYVDSYTDDRERYVLGRIKQITYSASVRANYIITPNLSVEYWGQPFISSGEYSRFKKVIEPNVDVFEKRYATYAPSEISFKDNAYWIEADGQPAYELENPDFNFMQFRSNFVVRWEYIPGSTLFLVWTSSASNDHQSHNNTFKNLVGDLAKTDGANIFLIKYTYRFIL
jgi:hypothetical protein